MMAVLRDLGKVPNKRDPLTLSSTSVSMEEKTVLKKLVGKVFKQHVDQFI